MRKPKPTRGVFYLEALEDRLCPSSLSLAGPLTKPDAATRTRLSQAYGQLPLSFEANQGQTNSQVNFLSRGSGYTLFLKPSEAVLALGQGAAGEKTPAHEVGRGQPA